MSTRAKVVIKDDHSEQYFYRHSDGYPDGALPTLKKFMNYIKTGQIRDNTMQSAGWLVLLGAQEYSDYWDHKGPMNAEKKSKTKEEILEPIIDWKCGAYEPSTDNVGWCDYVYIIDLVKKELTYIKTSEPEKIKKVEN